MKNKKAQTNFIVGLIIGYTIFSVIRFFWMHNEIIMPWWEILIVANIIIIALIIGIVVRRRTNKRSEE